MLSHYAKVSLPGHHWKSSYAPAIKEPLIPSDYSSGIGSLKQIPYCDYTMHISVYSIDDYTMHVPGVLSLLYSLQPY